MVSVQTREMRGQAMYECWAAESGIDPPPWDRVGRTIQSKWERIASRYHEKMGRHG